MNEPENPDQGTPGDETAAPDGQETNNDESADNVTDDGNSEDSQVTEESDESGVETPEPQNRIPGRKKTQRKLLLMETHNRQRNKL